MAARNGNADQLAANRNLCAAVFAVAAALAGLAQAVGAPLAVRVVLAAVGVVGALVGLGFHVLERKAMTLEDVTRYKEIYRDWSPGG